MATAPSTFDAAQVVNYFADNLLGLDGTSPLAQVGVSRAGTGAANDHVRIDIRIAAGPFVKSSVDLLSFVVDPARLKLDRAYEVDIQGKIDAKLTDYVRGYVAQVAAETDGVERGIVQAGTKAIETLLKNQVMEPLSGLVAKGLLDLSLPDRGAVTTVLGDMFDEMKVTYFKTFLPELTTTYAKMGLAEVLTLVTSGASPDWKAAINAVDKGVFQPVIDNLVSRYVLEAGNVKAFDNVDFANVVKTGLVDIFIDFDKWDKEVLDDLLGLDGDNKFEEMLAGYGKDQLRSAVTATFGKAVDFFAGKLDDAELSAVFKGIDIKPLLSDLFLNYAGRAFADLFIKVDSLEEVVVTNLGASIGSAALGETLGTIAGSTFTGLFQTGALNAVGASIFNGLGTIFGAGVGAIAGSLVFEIIDDLFDGKISGFFNDIVKWVRNDSPQAFYWTRYNPATSHFEHTNKMVSTKDTEVDLRRAVESLRTSFEKSANTVMDFIGEPVKLARYDSMVMAWGEKHLGSKFAAFEEGSEKNKIAHSKDAQAVVNSALGAVLRNMDTANPESLIGRAIDKWQAKIGDAASNATFATPESLSLLQSEIGLARFANDYRQDPTRFDAYMASNAPIAVTILKQYLDAEASGYNAARILRGSELKLETIGSAAAGDTIILNGPAVRAIARGGDDTIKAGGAREQWIDGGTGTDTVSLPGARSAYKVVLTDAARRAVVLTDEAGNVITLEAVERYQFAGTMMTFEEAFRDILSAGKILNGTAANDQITGTAGDDSIYGGNGHDQIQGGAGADFLLGDGGNDSIDGGDGKDRLFGWAGDDRLSGGADNDLLSGEAGNDLLDGGAGDDALDGGEGHDVAEGGSGSDTVLGSGGNDHLYGSARQAIAGSVDGGDFIVAGEGGDYIQGNAGQDSLFGEGGSDRIQGGADNDAVNGGAHNDTLNGNRGNDTVDGESGNDLARGGAGDDVVRGGAGEDTVYGDLGADFIQGGAGLDLLYGGNGGAGEREVDRFLFAPDDAPWMSGLTDQIADFLPGTDKIVLQGIGSTYSLLTDMGPAQASIQAAYQRAIAMRNADGTADNLGEVAAVQVGNATLLVFGADQALLLPGVMSTALRPTDFELN